LVAIAVAIGIAYADVFARLGRIWWNKDDYSHGFAVPIVVLVYLWIRRAAIRDGFEANHSLGSVVAGLGLIGMAVGLRVAGILGRALPVEAISLLPLAAGVLLLLCGTKVLWRALPAIAFLIFMIPLPGQISGPVRQNLQSVATNVSVFSLQTMGVPAVSRGNVIALPDAEVGVAEACSGLRMLYAFAALTVGITFFLERSLIEKSILLLAIVPIAVIMNAWRVVMVSLASQYSPEWSDRVHDVAGWGMMILALGLIFALLKFLGALIITAPPSPQPSTAKPSAAGR
jgi:exosortase